TVSRSPLTRRSHVGPSAVRVGPGTAHRVRSSQSPIRGATKPMFDRLNRALQQHLDPNRATPQLRQPTVESLLPSDVVSFWDGGDNVVQAVLECREELNRRETIWRWNILDEGRVLEFTPEGNTLYERTA